ncbi:MAG: ketoacyl-ACP synthase III [Nakamurella sp.]
MNARISAIDYYLPENTLTNADLSAEFPEWSVEKIARKTGITNRHVAADDEFSSDLAVRAAERLFARGSIDPGAVDYLLLVTQSPDYFLPSTAALVHERLGLRSNAGATDVSLGCSGFIYALGLAKGLIESEQASTVLVVTADTYTKFLNPQDKSVRTIFGDGASATLITADGTADSLYAFSYGTDGSGAGHLLVPHGGLRPGEVLSPESAPDRRGLATTAYDLFMNGAEIFNFTIRTVPGLVDSVMAKAGLAVDDVDLFVFHQANKFMLEHLRTRLGIPAEKFPILMADSGNTVSGTIPIALAMAVESGILQRGMTLLLVGFGVGLSWAGSAVTW